MRENARLEFDRKPDMEDNSSPDVLLHEVSGSVEGKANIMERFVTTKCRSLLCVCHHCSHPQHQHLIISNYMFLEKCSAQQSNWKCMLLVKKILFLVASVCLVCRFTQKLKNC